MRRDAGLTIIEVLIALVLIAVMAAGIAGLTVISARFTRDARIRATATIMAAQKLEQLRSLSSADAGGGVPEDTDYLDAGGRTLASGGGPPPTAVYVRHWSVVPAGASCDCLIMTVRVTPSAGGQRGVRLFSLRARTAGND